MKFFVAQIQILVLLSVSLAATSSNSVTFPRDAPVAVGDVAPDFSLVDQNGKTVSLADARSQGPVVLVFYRGYWCPFCGRQLSSLRSLLKKGEKVRLIAISVDPPETSKEFAGKIAADGKGAVVFPLLSDPGHKTIDAYGLHDPAYDGQQLDGIPHPAVYVINQQGKVVWAKIETDYRQRPSNQDIRTVLDGLK